jgi:chromosome segregation ATPase
MNDEIREQIAAKIKAKRVATENKRPKPKNLRTQKDMYLESIEGYKERIAKLEALIAKNEESSRNATSEVTQGVSELKHMEEILSRYDKGVEEKVECSQRKLRVINRYEQQAVADMENWRPGQGSFSARAKQDPEYVEAEERVVYLDKMLPECLKDINRIYSSRGDVSPFNVKGRKDV